jgi:toxin CcdB
MPERAPVSIARLNPRIDIEGKTYRAVVQHLAAIPRNRLGAAVANASGQHTEFVAAIDLVFTGI